MVDKNHSNPQTGAVGQSIESTLQRTDLGQVIRDHKGLVIAAFVGLVAAIIGASIYSYYVSAKEKETLEKVFVAGEEIFAPYFAEKIKHEQVVEKIKGLDALLLGEPNLTPSVFEVALTLQEAKREDLALELLSLWQKNLQPGSHLALYCGLRLAPLYENQGQIDQAASLYEELLKANHKLLEDKLYYELGRLYLKQGQGEKSKSFFDHLLAHHKDSEYAKRAKVYLDEMSEE